MAYYCKSAKKAVRPVMSTDFREARLRALGLYRAIYRYIPYIRHFKRVEPFLNREVTNTVTQEFYIHILLDKMQLIQHPQEIVKYFDIQKNEEDCRWKLREYFYRNACITDLRVIDILVIKGYIELKEMTHQWQQKGHLMRHWHPTLEPKRCDFLGKFFAGVD